MNIVETFPNAPNFELFQKVLYNIYESNAIRLKQSDVVSEEYLKKCVVLLKENEPIGRLTVYENTEIKYGNYHVFCIGNFECIDDDNASAMLLNWAKNFIKNNNGNLIIGPMNGSTWENYRFSENHDSPFFFLEQDHHLYYNKQFSKFGFKVLSKYFSSQTNNLEFEDEHVNHLSHQFKLQGVTIRNIDLLNFELELKKLYPFLLEAFKTNFLYSSISFENFSSKYLQLKSYINSQFALIAEDKHGEMIGVFFCIHDYYNTNSKTIILKTLARKFNKKWAGLGQVLSQIIYQRAKEQGYTELVHAFIIEDGTSVQSSQKFQGKPFKNYFLYALEI